nr:TrbM/KikA/MpfK family conjugal transfer protein [Pseudomonas sp. NFPP33]AGH89248.1 hypothetical protein [uncultured bacterium]
MNKTTFMKTIAIAALFTASANIALAEETDTSTDIYQGVVNDPRGSIANSTVLSEEQKAQLLQTYDSANGKAVPACGTILCMSGTMQGGSGGSACKGPINDYFDIKKFRKGKFSPSKTASARKSYLDKCDAPDSASDKARINAKFGTVPNAPF